MYSFPPVYPATAGNMNYVSVVYVVTGAVAIAWWFIKARVRYNPEMLQEER